MKVESRTKGVLCVVVFLAVAGVFLCQWVGREGRLQPLANVNSENQGKSGVALPAPERVTSAETGPAATTSLSDDAAPGESASGASLESWDGDLPAAPLAASIFSGQPTDLLPAEEMRAVEIWKREANMWSTLKSFSGDVELSYIDEQRNVRITALAKAQVQVRTMEPGEVDRDRHILPAMYEVTLTDKDNRWTLISNGTSRGTELRCRDESLAAELKPLLNQSLAQVIGTPSTVLRGLYSDKYPQDDASFFAEHQPTRNPAAGDRPDSYMFGASIVETPRNVVLFEDGHFSCWGDGAYGQERVKLGFGDYQETNGFWFPTTMMCRHPSVERRLTWSNLTIDASAEKPK